jgi:M6 family metalloprotease-like protein
MRKITGQSKSKLPARVALPVLLAPAILTAAALAATLTLLSTSACRRAPSIDVTLSEARFNGLTRIVATTDVTLTGLDAAQVVITRPDGMAVPPDKITDVTVSDNALSVVIDVDQFARITSAGTTIATRAFDDFKASQATAVQKIGEPVANGRIIGTSTGLDEGWNTIRTDLDFIDPVTGEKGLYRFSDVTPDRDDNNNPIDWNDGLIITPAHRDSTMLMLLVEFPDRRAADAGAPYTELTPYVEFMQGAVEWFARSSYGQFRFTWACPQADKQLGWIMMDKNARDYQWGGSTVVMFNYIGEACQKAYDNWDIKADDYDLLLVMPARGKSGLRNGPANINHDPGDGQEPNTNRVAYVDRDNKPHYIDTAITAGNDLFRWGYRWAVHECGHTFGLPDIYSYGPVIDDVKVHQFFFCGGWDMMGFIAGHSTDFLAWNKWKMRWIRDDQVDVVSQSSPDPTTHFVTPVETPGGSKMVVIRTGLSTAYVVEFRTRLGVNALDELGKFSGVLIYRIDATKPGPRGRDFTGQIISKKYYHSEAVGGPENLTGLWRPIDNSIDGYDSSGCCWQPGDVFSDPSTGVTIRIDGITHYDSSDHDNSPYTADDVATVTVTKTMDAELFRSVVLSNARLKNLTDLAFDTNIELQHRIPNANARSGGNFTYIREDSLLYPVNVVITKSDGSIVPAEQIIDIDVSPSSVQVTLAEGTFADAQEAAGISIATKAYFNFGPGAAVPVRISD